MTDRHPQPETGPLGEKLAELRLAAGLTLYELEKRSGINRPKLMRIENGAIRQPKTETLNKLAAALDVDPEELYDAAWAESEEPLPSLPTYFRSKFALSDEQIAAVERTVQRLEKKQSQDATQNATQHDRPGSRASRTASRTSSPPSTSSRSSRSTSRPSSLSTKSRRRGGPT